MLAASDLLQLAQVARDGGDLDAAEQNYSRLLAEFPASTEAFSAQLGIGDVRMAREDFEGARAAYRAATAAANPERAAEARLAVGNSFVSEFESLDGGREGFVDEAAAGEFLANAEAIEAFRALAEDTGLSRDTRQQARFKLADAFFRARQFPQARAAYTEYLSGSPASMDAQRAHIQMGLAFVEEGNSSGASIEFAAAGASTSSPAGPEVSASRHRVLGEFFVPSGGFLDLADIVIVVQRSARSAITAAELNARAELGLALTKAYVDNDSAAAIARLESLAAHSFAAPVGDLARFQLAELRRKDGDRGGAVKEYGALLSEFPASSFARLAEERLGALLTELFSSETRTASRADGRLLRLLTTMLRRAVGDSPEPAREARSLALNVLGNLDAEGIPLPLTIAMPAGLAPVVVGVPARQQLAAFGGTPPLTWSLEPGSTLPEGLTLSGGGLLAGTPAGPARAVLRLKVRDGAGDSDSRPFVLTSAPFRIRTLPRLADGVIGSSYSTQLEAEGEGPFTYESLLVRRTTEQGRLATVDGFVPGLSLSPDGAIRGTPSQESGAAPYTVALRARDARGRSQAAFFYLFVAPADVAAKTPTSGPAPYETVASSSTLPVAAPGEEAAQAARETGFDSPMQGGPEEGQSASGSAPPVTETTVPALALQLAVTPDGKSVVAISGIAADVLTVLDIESGKTRALTLPGPRAAGVFPFTLAISPDSRTAAIAIRSTRLGRMLIVDLAQLVVVRTVTTGPRTEAVAFTPDGRRAVARSSQQVTSVDLSSGTTRVVPLGAIGQGRSLAVFPDSRRVLVASQSTANRAVVIDLDSGSQTSLPLPAAASFAEVLPGGQEAVLSETQGDHLILLDLRTGVSQRLFARRGVSSFAVSADGSTIAAIAASSSELAVLDVKSR
ncbi:MAG: tetratricopeptide repeat protein, partial [Candidatus Wallbacteria bacterium]|nr:tetratricopeptide repeat protein [Candidatus Wallbacteria bacterium]